MKSFSETTAVKEFKSLNYFARRKGKMARIALGVVVSLTLRSISIVLAAPSSQTSHQESILTFHTLNQLSAQDVETDTLHTFEVTIDGDKILRTGETSDSTSDSVLANPKMLWPGGLVEYKFYRKFSRYFDVV